MLWVSRRSPSEVERNNQRRSYRQSIELPIAIEVAGLPAPVYGTLVNISETGCRLRSLILVDRDRDVTFELKRQGQQAISLHGRIVTRVTPAVGGGYEYGVTFRQMLSTDRAVLGKAIQEMQRREAATRADSRLPAKRPAASSAQRRHSLRTMVGFPVRYRPNQKAGIMAEANDVSTGGLRLICGEELAIGTSVALTFTLPSDVLWVYPRATERAEITPFGPRMIRIPDNRRPFEEMTLHGRIVSRFQPTRGREVYGVQFTDIEGYAREEIARFAHAAQLAKLRVE
jgi:c-di-GMP-binding flagellar brake protein YcgR